MDLKAHLDIVLAVLHAYTIKHGETIVLPKMLIPPKTARHHHWIKGEIIEDQFVGTARFVDITVPMDNEYTENEIDEWLGDNDDHKNTERN